jgi:transcriptional regulator with XRE-family HTH domain
MAFVNDMVGFLNRRRRELGLSYQAIAEQSGLSLPTVRRILADGQPSATLSSVLAIARVLGARLTVSAEVDADEFLERQAREKAERLVGMVHASSALEGQGLDAETRAQMVRQTVHELLAGSRRKLWASR